MFATTGGSSRILPRGGNRFFLRARHSHAFSPAGTDRIPRKSCPQSDRAMLLALP
jgi:hypothetical protein